MNKVLVARVQPWRAHLLRPFSHPVSLLNQAARQDEVPLFGEFLDSRYDCVDRVVLRAYLQIGQAPAGFRTFWPHWKGSDEGLDNARLMRIAGRFSRRVRSRAEKKGVPIVYSQAGERNERISEKCVPADPRHEGIFLVIIDRAPGNVWDVVKTADGRIRHIKPEEPISHRPIVDLPSVAGSAKSREAASASNEPRTAWKKASRNEMVSFAQIAFAMSKRTVGSRVVRRSMRSRYAVLISPGGETPEGERGPHRVEGAPLGAVQRHAECHRTNAHVHSRS